MQKHFILMAFFDAPSLPMEAADEIHLLHTYGEQVKVAKNHAHGKTLYVGLMCFPVGHAMSTSRPQRD